LTSEQLHVKTRGLCRQRRVGETNMELVLQTTFHVHVGCDAAAQLRFIRWSPVEEHGQYANAWFPGSISSTRLVAIVHPLQMYIDHEKHKVNHDSCDAHHHDDMFFTENVRTATHYQEHSKILGTGVLPATKGMLYEKLSPRLECLAL